MRSVIPLRGARMVMISVHWREVPRSCEAWVNQGRMGGRVSSSTIIAVAVAVAVVAEVGTGAVLWRGYRLPQLVRLRLRLRFLRPQLMRLLQEGCAGVAACRPWWVVL